MTTEANSSTDSLCIDSDSESTTLTHSTYPPSEEEASDINPLVTKGSKRKLSPVTVKAIPTSRRRKTDFYDRDLGTPIALRGPVFLQTQSTPASLDTLQPSFSSFADSICEKLNFTAETGESILVSSTNSTSAETADPSSVDTPTFGLSTSQTCDHPIEGPKTSFSEVFADIIEPTNPRDWFDIVEMDPPIKGENMGTVRIDPEQFKELFNECISSVNSRNFITDVVRGELKTIDERVKVLATEVQSHRSQLVSVDDLREEHSECTNHHHQIKLLGDNIGKLTQDVAELTSLKTMQNELKSLSSKVDKCLGDNVVMCGNLKALEDKMCKIDVDIVDSHDGVTGSGLVKLQEKLVKLEVDLQKVQPETTQITDFSKVEERLAMMENNSNMKFLLFDGIPEQQNEQIPEHLVEHMRGKLEPGFNLADLENARRIGPRTESKPRPILAEFVYAYKRKRVYQTRMQLARVKDRVFISEYLTKNASHMFYLCRQEFKQKRIGKCWTTDGNVYFSVSKTSRGICVKKPSDLFDIIGHKGTTPPQNDGQIASTSRHSVKAMET